ncbi:aldehyde dehydrogenase [Microsporum canis CBS 113480]|uniref:Aldehyde dehydrogenase n=1 Tax=Arthroderma otae (strain ATCC MYA-4605 / CBS 113480) TaxID=554155 RepID=C5FGG3_ARTOC|nr:aldehyde dehydrogenase [Microsporum canis CBS 113480]EEQ29848.1 aldehyde dehydrogenase [Microsporum canis CBS 113480]
MSSLSVELTAPNGRKYVQPLGLFINNEFVAAKSGQTIVSVNPTDETDIATVHAAGAEDVDIAVNAARAALKHPSWKDLSGSDRGRMMVKLSELVEQHAETLATIETWDNGKPYLVSLGDDVSEVASVLRYYGGFADKIEGRTISTTANKFAYTLRQPIGVVGQIIPWNFPLAMAAWKLGPALACGNTVILKAAEQTPLSVLYLAGLVKEAGFPPGVVNIINGYGKDAGAAIASHTGIDKIAFTGSTSTGRAIMKMAAANLKNITLETGGKSPLIVFDDADIDQAAKWAHTGIMYNMGQVCTATSRLLVHEGAQVTKAQYDRVLSYIETGKSEGATLATGGVPHQKVGNGKGYFIEPTVFTNVTDNMAIYREEVFGPFAVIASFKTEEEALTKANDTTYGLGAAVFTQNIERGHRVACGIEAGMVWINSSNDSDFRVPFGGVKQSGVGRELGEAGLEAYSQIKAVHLNMGTRL